MTDREIVVTYLEMTTPHFPNVAAPANIKHMLMRADDITPAFYRFLYASTGQSMQWNERSRLADPELKSLITAPGVDVWGLYANGQPAGFFELAPDANDTVHIAYAAILPEFRQVGLGKWLLSEAIRAAWEKLPKRVTVETTTLDGPEVLRLYQTMGFAPYNQMHRKLARV